MNNRVWVYLSDRVFDKKTTGGIENDLRVFLEGWNAHGTALKATYELLHDRFIILKADEAVFTASGCSIDKQLRFIKETEQKYGISLLNRLLVAYKKGDEIRVIHSSRVQELLSSGEINENTIIFNLAVSNEQELQNNFETPLKKSWVGQTVTR